jgi:hypothetical protein
MNIYKFLKFVIEGKIEAGIDVTGRQGRKYKQLLDVLNENRNSP